MDNLEVVLKTLQNAEQPLKGKDISEISGLEKKDVDKAIKQLVKEEKAFSPKRCFYSAK